MPLRRLALHRGFEHLAGSYGTHRGGSHATPLRDLSLSGAARSSTQAAILRWRVSPRRLVAASPLVAIAAVVGVGAFRAAVLWLQ